MKRGKARSLKIGAVKALIINGDIALITSLLIFLSAVAS